MPIEKKEVIKDTIDVRGIDQAQLPVGVGGDERELDRELECFIADVAFDVVEEDAEFALKVKNEDAEQYEFVMRIATGEMVPDRYCYFDKSSLENFAKDAASGVPLLQSHNSYRDVAIGYTFLGEYVSSRKYVNAAAYIIKGLRLNSGYSYSESDGYILSLQKKGIREVSMGIYGGTAICSICGGNYMSYRECQHWRGKEYPVGPNRVMRLCYYTWHDSHLDEVSLVANGAVPGAMILKAQQMLEKGEIFLADITKAFEKSYKSFNVTETFLRNRIPYRLFSDKLSGEDSVNAGEESAELAKGELATELTTGVSVMEADQSEQQQQQEEERIEMDLTATVTSLQGSHPSLQIPDDPVEALNALATGYSAAKATVETQQAQLKQLQEQNAKLQMAANDGQSYREEWRKKAEELHVARFGQPLGEVYVSLFDNERTPASEIKKYAEQWQKELESATEGTEQLNSGEGRPRAKTVEGHQGGQGSATVLLPKIQPLG